MNSYETKMGHIFWGSQIANPTGRPRYLKDSITGIKPVVVPVQAGANVFSTPIMENMRPPPSKYPLWTT